MDPLTTGLITQASKRAIEHGKEKFVDLFYSEVGAFLKVLKKEIGHDPTIPWEQIDSGRVNPEFIGIAQSLIEGHPGAREAMNEFIGSLQIPDTYGNEKEAKEKISRAMMRAAVEAPRSDRVALLASERRIEESIERRNVLGVEESGNKRDEQLKRQLREALETAFQGVGSSAAGIDPEYVRAQIETKLWSDGALDSSAIAEQEPYGDPDTSLGRQRPNSRTTALRLRSSDAKRIDRVLTELGRDDPDGIEVLRGLLADGGMDSVVRSLKSDTLEGRSPALLDAEGQIAGLHGAFAEAERAHLAAAEQCGLVGNQVRQLVRAASMASALGKPDRAAELRNRAEGISPGHPAIVIAEARAESDPDRALALLEDVSPESDREALLLHISRAQAYLYKSEFDQADEELAAARHIEPDDLGVREVEAMLPWLQAREDVAEGRSPDVEKLLEAAGVFRGMAADLATHNRESEQGQLLARAAEAAVLAGDPGAAIEALELAPERGLMAPQATAALGNAAMLAGRPDMAARLTAGASEGGKDGLVLADAKLHSDSAEERKDAAAHLADLLSSDDDEVRDQAAYSLLSGAVAHRDVDWNEQAAEIVDRRNSVVAAVLRAELLAAEGKFEPAEAVLLPHVSDSRAQRLLVYYAERQKAWTKARDRLTELVKTRSDGGMWLRLANATWRAGSPLEAREIYLRLARDADLDAALRGAAFSGAVELVGNNFEEIRKLASEWREELPSEQNAIWNLMFALARLARHDEAYELSVAERPDADTPERAVLYAEILGRAADGSDALRAIAALSDRYDKKVEALEGLFIATALQVEQEDPSQIDGRMGGRIRESIARFPERFPDQDYIRSFAVPESAEEFEALLEEHAGGNTAQRQRQVQQEIVDGAQPVNTLAAVAPHGELSRAWAGLAVLPLGFSAEPTDQVERDAAAGSIGKGVVWDTAAMFVTGGLGADHPALVRGLFPGSRISQESLENADLALANTPRRGHMETVQNPDTGTFEGLRESDDAELDRLARINKGMVDLARSLGPEPWAGSGGDKRLDEMHEKAAAHRSWREMAATLALAKRRNMPLFSDDRWIRNAARAFGIEAFGTVALIDVLAEREAIDPNHRAYLRRLLFVAGAWGLRPTGTEMIAFARSSEFLLDGAMAGALTDRAAWRSQPVQYLHQALAFLQVVHEEAPERFRIWSLRILDALQGSTPELPKDDATKTLVALAWDIGDDAELTTPALRELIRVVRRLPLRMTEYAFDPVKAAFNFILQSLPVQSQLRPMLFIRLVGQLPPEDIEWALDTYVKPPRRTGPA